MSGSISFCLVDPEPVFHVAPGARVFDRYELIDLLGMGGTANVWRGQVLGTSHQVAVKIQNQGPSTGALRSERLEREYQLLSLICSPYVVAVNDCGVLPDGRIAVVFECMRGSTLREVMEAQDTFELVESLEITSQLLRALVDVQAQGIVHRDIKPDNIMILSDPSGPRRVKLFDFGIAKVTSEDARIVSGLGGSEIAELLMPLTSAEMTVGTPEYMAPEQISGTCVGMYTDVYAVGIVLFEMLFGEVPYTGRNFFEIAHKHLAGLLPPLDADLPLIVQELIWRALSCLIDDRYESAEVMLRAVEEALASPEVINFCPVDTDEQSSLTAFLAGDLMDTWTHAEESGLERLSSDSSMISAPESIGWSGCGAPQSISPGEWLDDVAISSQVVALKALEEQAGARQAAQEALTFARLGSPVEAPSRDGRRMRLSSDARRSLTAQLQASGAAESRPPSASGSTASPAVQAPEPPATRAPWEVHIEQGGAEDAATEDISIPDLIDVMRDRKRRQAPGSFEHGATSLFVRPSASPPAARLTQRWAAASWGDK